MTQDAKSPGAVAVAEAQKEAGHLNSKAETRQEQNVLILAASAIGILPVDLQRMAPAAARSLALVRLREIEGVAESLSRQADALEGFLARLRRLSAETRDLGDLIGGGE